jgi:histidinol-phosphate aminotransferase
MSDNIDRLVRPMIRELEPYVPIEPPEVLAKREGIPLDQIIKMDANENPYGPSPKVAEALGLSSGYNIYPDPFQRDVRDALAAYAGVDAECVVAGSGADELIELVVRLTMDPGNEAIDLTPTFGMYAVTMKMAGVEVVEVPRNEAFGVDMEAVRAAVNPRTKLLFLCNPNNPTGTLTPESTVRELLSLGPVVVVDETYHEFCGFTVAHLVPEYDNLVVLRSLSKWAGLAGVRLGYGIMTPKLVTYIMGIKQPYNISVPAQTALFATLQDTDLLLQRVRSLVEERERMRGLLEDSLGVHCYPSKGNFLLCKFPKGQAPELQAKLAKKGIFVRRFGDDRLGDCLRISSGRPADTDALINALKELQG